MKFWHRPASLFDRRHRSVRTLVRDLFVVLAAVPIAVMAVYLVSQTYFLTTQSVLKHQETLARFAGSLLESTVDRYFTGLELFSDNTALHTQPPPVQEQILRSLVNTDNDVDEVSLVAADGAELQRLSRLRSLSAREGRPWAEDEVFRTSLATGTVRVGNFGINPVTREPVMEVAIPVGDSRTGDPQAVLLATIRMKLLSRTLASLPLAESEVIYLVNDEGDVVAHADPSVVLSRTRLESTSSEGIRPGIGGTPVVARSATVQLGGTTFEGVAEKTLAAAYAPLVLAGVAGVIIMTLVIVGIGRARTALERAVVYPIEYLARATEQAQGQHLDLELDSEAAGESLRLAEALNDMHRRIAETVAGLERSNREKDVLLREVHHRVKNNLQIIRSMLSLQRSMGVESASPAEALASTHDRVLAMSLVHEQVYASEDVSRIAFDSYLSSLVSNLTSVYEVDPARITIEVSADPVHLDLNTAVPCALVANELISNAIKHAFPDEKSGHIQVILSKQGDAGCSLEVRDDGVGMPTEQENSTAASTLGFTLVRALTEQLQGRFEVEADNGGTRAVLSTHASRPLTQTFNTI